MSVLIVSEFQSFSLTIAKFFSMGITVIRHSTKGSLARLSAGLREQESGAAPTPAGPSARTAGWQKLVPCHDTGFLPPDPLPFCSPAGDPQRFFRAAGPQIGWRGKF